MKHVSMLDFRLHAERIIAQVQQGEKLILTRRGKPVARLEPINVERIDEQDPFYTLCERAVPGESLSNEQMDRIVYGV